MFSKNAVSPVVATALLLVVAVVSVVSFQGWFQTFSSQVFTETEEQGSISGTNIVEIKGETLYFDTGDIKNLSIKAVKVDGVSCDIQQNLSGGLEQLDMSGCISNASGSTEVTVVSEQGVTSEMLYFQPKDSSNTGQLQPSEYPTLSGTFITVWNTSRTGVSNSTSIQLPLQADGYYNFTVTGNTLINSPVTITNYSNNTLEFTSSGIHQINITGDITGWKFEEPTINGPFSSPTWYTDNKKLLEIKEWGPLRLGNAGGYFTYVYYVDISATDKLHLQHTSNLSKMFKMPDPNGAGKTGGTEEISISGDINNWDTSSVTDMSEMFYAFSGFNKPISNWDTSNVENMTKLFAWTSFNQSVNTWDTSSLKDMRLMFLSNGNFDQPLNNWDTSSVKDMYGVFTSATSFNQSLDDWNVSSVTNMHYMFGKISDTYSPYGAQSFDQNISMWCPDINSEPTNFDLDSGFENETALQPNWGSC